MRVETEARLDDHHARYCWVVDAIREAPLKVHGIRIHSIPEIL